MCIWDAVTHRSSMVLQDGYCEASAPFTFHVFLKTSSASSSMYVVTNVAKFILQEKICSLLLDLMCMDGETESFTFQAQITHKLPTWAVHPTLACPRQDLWPHVLELCPLETCTHHDARCDWFG